jgi:hypothetical protein
MRGSTRAGFGHRLGRSPQEAVRGAVAATAHTRPGVGAHAGQHAAWWARNSATLHLIADHEHDPSRAQAVRSDAVTSQRLAEAMAASHTAHAADLSPVPMSTAGMDVGAELADVSDLDVLEVGL